MKILYMAVIASVLVACASPSPTWQRSGMSQHDVNNAISKCRYDVGLAKVEANEKNQLIRDCLQSQGFRYR